jgi:hypothetical protein
MAQLVRDDHLVGRRQAPLVADRIQAPVAGPLVVETRDVLLQQPRPQRAQVRARLQQVEGDERALLGCGALGGVFGVEVLEVAAKPSRLR